MEVHWEWRKRLTVHTLPPPLHPASPLPHSATVEESWEAQEVLVGPGWPPHPQRHHFLLRQSGLLHVGLQGAHRQETRTFWCHTVAPSAVPDHKKTREKRKKTVGNGILFTTFLDSTPRYGSPFFSLLLIEVYCCYKPIGARLPHCSVLAWPNWSILPVLGTYRSSLATQIGRKLRRNGQRLVCVLFLFWVLVTTLSFDRNIYIRAFGV